MPESRSTSRCSTSRSDRRTSSRAITHVLLRFLGALRDRLAGLVVRSRARARPTAPADSAGAAVAFRRGVGEIAACSDSWLRSSEPAFGANSMPRPAPSTVPVSSPITKLPPPPSWRMSLSKRSYPSAIDRLLFRIRFCPLRSPAVDAAIAGVPRSPPAARGRNPTTRLVLCPHVGPHPVGRVVDPIHRRSDRVVDALGLFLHLLGDALDVVEDRVDRVMRSGTICRCSSPLTSSITRRYIINPRRRCR